MKCRRLILGIGNCLMRDDGVGVHAVRQMQANPHAQVDLLDGGVDFFAAIPWIEACEELLAIDAMEAGGAPGSVYGCRGEDLAPDDRLHTLHGLGLMSALEFIEASLRPRVWLLGVEPARIEFGMDLSPQVAAALPAVMAFAREFATGSIGSRWGWHKRLSKLCQARDFALNPTQPNNGRGIHSCINSGPIGLTGNNA